MRLALSLACVLFASTVTAQDLEAEHQRGVQLRAQGQNAEAATVFRAIFERTGEPRALARLGLAEGALSRWSDADEHLQTALSRTSDPWITANRASLEQALRAIRTHLGFVNVTCATSGATVQLGTAPPQPLPLQQPLRVSTGFVDLVVRAPGHHPAERHVAVPAGQDPVQIEVTLTPSTEPATPPPAPARAPVDTPPPAVISPSPPAPVTPSPRSTWHRPVGIGLLAGGGVALGLGVLGVILREGAAARFNEQRCLLHPDRDEVTSGGMRCVEELSNVQGAQTLSVAGFVAAGVLGAAGVTVFLLAPRANDTVRVDVAADAQSARGSVTLRF